VLVSSHLISEIAHTADALIVIGRAGCWHRPRSPGCPPVAARWKKRSSGLTDGVNDDAGELLLGTLGVLTITTESSSGMIRATFAAVPRRPLVLATKAAVLGAVTLAAGEISALAGGAWALPRRDV
jgi:hypothetical protein